MCGDKVSTFTLGDWVIVSEKVRTGTMLTGHKVLLIGEDYDSLMLINFHLQQANYEVLMAWNIGQALEYVRQERPLLAVVDRGSTELVNYELCRAIRQLDGQICLAVLSNQSGEESRVKSFEAGADDYIVKPFNARELVLRVNAMLRRAIRPTFTLRLPDKPISAPAHDLPHKRVFNFQIDIQRRQVYKDGREVELTRLEFDLLKFLYEHRGYVMSRDRLLESVWKYSQSGDERVVDVVMARLRKKLEDDPNSPNYIQTIRGVGYKYVA